MRLGDGPGDDMIGLALDWQALNISAQAIGDGVNDIDYFPHGLTTYKLSEDEPTRIPSAPSGGTSAAAPQAAAKATQFHGDQIRSASPLKDLGMPIGTVSDPIKIQTTTPAAKKLSMGADNAKELVPGYTPQQIQARLGLKGDGTGQTIAIVDAYHYPTAKDDLNHFSAHFNLPQTCDTVSAGADCFDFQQAYADGTQPEADTGWNEEEALDIEWAHSVAPHAKIVLVEAADPTMAGLSQADDAAAALHPSAVSNSWGAGEFSEQGFYDGHCKLADSVCVQSTGDAGYPAGYSATNPYVLAIGGTTLQLDANGNTVSETAWHSTGGGLSYFEPRPAYQDGVQSSPLRATPDVSFVADPVTGVPVYLTMTYTMIAPQIGADRLVPPTFSHTEWVEPPRPTSSGPPPASPTWPRTAGTGTRHTPTSMPSEAPTCGTSSPAPTAAAARNAQPAPATTPSPASARPLRVSTRLWRP
ncbi:hypothetical protein ACFYZB_23140 [Streptomyces sp. NPDC001852]|uniref:S53 family peptidase n=1 Tax=Streptomyces sp. NPDC001852 TaxID=3364619 RepID=UPI0036979DCA